MAAKKDNLPTYERPPVIEVVCGVGFERISQFRAPHSGLLWDKFRDEYPTCEHADRVGSFVFENLKLPLPRIWFISHNKNHVIQVQDDRFLFNWRRTSEADQYPRYSTVIAAFRQKFDVFQQFIREVDLGPLKLEDCELTYINHIRESPIDVPKIFPDLRWSTNKKRFLPKPSTMGWQTVFVLPKEKGHLNVRVRPAKVAEESMIVLELSARGLGAERSTSEVWDWFGLAHEWIVLSFADLTNREIQRKIWKRKG